MTQIVKLTNQYIKLHNSIFNSQEHQTIYYFKDFEKTNILDMSKLYPCSSNIVFEFEYYALIITNYYYNSNFRILENLNSIIFEEELSVLKSVTFLCGVGGIPFWSESFSDLIDILKLHNVSVELIESDECYDILPVTSASQDQQFKMFKKYISTDCPGLRTKDSDFLLKHTFNSFRDPRPEDKSLAFYLERKYTGFIYGYLELERGSEVETIFNFWFKDLFSIQCDVGIGHWESSCWCSCYKFYFILACKDSVISRSKINKLMSLYKIVLVEYNSGPVAFIEEFMHYKAQVSFLNHYFIGIYNKDDWVLFIEVFQKISQEINDTVWELEYAITVEDKLTFKEYYHLRFASLMFSLLYDVPQALRENNVPWFAVPKALVEFRRTDAGARQLLL